MVIGMKITLFTQNNSKSECRNCIVSTICRIIRRRAFHFDNRSRFSPAASHYETPHASASAASETATAIFICRLCQRSARD